MLIYLLKFSACLLILLVFYKLFLEKLNAHGLKRFYLLVTLVLSAIIPFITFTEYVFVESTPIVANTQLNFTPETNLLSLAKKIDYTASILWVIYGIGVLIFAIKFTNNLVGIYKRVRQNPKKKAGMLKHVLLQETIVPHTFFSFLFFNKERYDARQIPEEVFWHEETHAKQKHSLDILFIELLQILFWFNPLIYFAKRAIKLNHEFLADQGVLNRGVHSSNYQKILLSFSSNDLEPQLANAINYSSIKKRFTIMKTHTSIKATLLRSLFFLPLLALLVYSFSSTEILEIDSANPTELNPIEQELEPINVLELNFYDAEQLTENIHVKINKRSQLLVGQSLVTVKELPTLLLRFNGHLSKEERAKTVKASIQTVRETPKKVLFEVEKILNAYGVAQIDIIGVGKRQISETIKNKKRKSLEVVIDTKIIILNNKEVSLSSFAKAVDAHTKNWKKTDYTSIKPRVHIINSSKEFLNKVDTEFKKTHFSKSNEGMNIIPPAPPVSQSATRKQMATYNKLAKYYNDMANSHMRINKKDVELLAYIYSLMSDKQKEDAEPYPNFPKPPAPPKAPRVAKGEISKIPPPPLVDAIAIDKIMEISGPPSPPEPIAPLDYAIAMAKKGAIFYLEDKKVTSDKAISALKKNKNLNISVKESTSKQPIMHITTKPIIIKN
ncbi:MAG: hypothetical protein COA50_03685 [Flavobacteriaceae bacterium]|nr:MAG: hypothetical protein COA50_03685 [Flavobacteriaceae bacterium]